MASTTVALAGIIPSSTSLNTSSSSSSASPSPSSSSKPSRLSIRASSSSEEPSRRSLLRLLAISAPASFLSKHALADASSIKVEGPPPPSGGLPGTENADEARDVELPLKNRFFLQPLPPAEAIARAKESAKDIVGVKALIDKKAWPYVQNDLRLKASYLRFDINSVVSSKNKEEKKLLKPLVAKVFDNINNLDYAARTKSVPNAEKYYAITVSSLNDLLAKLG